MIYVERLRAVRFLLHSFPSFSTVILEPHSLVVCLVTTILKKQKQEKADVNSNIYLNFKHSIEICFLEYRP